MDRTDELRSILKLLGDQISQTRHSLDSQSTNNSLSMIPTSPWQILATNLLKSIGQNDQILRRIEKL